MTKDQNDNIVQTWKMSGIGSGVQNESKAKSYNTLNVN